MPSQVGQVTGAVSREPSGRRRPVAMATLAKPEQVPQRRAGARLLISGHPVPEVLLVVDPAEAPVTVEELRAAVDRVWELTHNNQFTELSRSLGALLSRIERAARTAPVDQRPQLWGQLSRTYQALSAAFVRQDEGDAAWIAADRSIRAAEESGQPLDVFAGVFRLAQAFVRLKHYDQADHAATTALHALQRYLRTSDAGPEALSVAGSLHLVLALTSARSGDRARARQELDHARKMARKLGEDRNDFNLEFGPTNVEIQTVSIAVDLGDAGEAIDVGTRIDASGLSAERQARLLLDLGRAYTQRRQLGEALSALLQAEELSPDLIHTHVTARATVQELLLVAGRSATPELRSLAERADARG
ncbi:tetratricopeptide repeat protein [Kitasatospora fiedleri]|uniref:tetratricopeptide repeat protein n=1 Tax=Kitasatospora fiedleri TaxID=2991545 RepID=UPI002989DD3B|nr:transcriptional regulator [Kitasatospora fiedleri]